MRLRLKIQFPILKMPLGYHHQAGKTNANGAWWPNAEFMFPGAFHHIKSPRNRPIAYRDHFYSMKYAKGLSAHRPLIYMAVHQIDPSSEIGKILIAREFERRLKGGNPCSSD